MATVRPRITINADTWNAIEAMAKLRGVHPSTIAEEFFNAGLDQSKNVERLASMVNELIMNAVRTGDDIRFIADYVVDKYRSESEA